jgi:predicted nucleotidyltransferase component of viral defense system
VNLHKQILTAEALAQFSKLENFRDDFYLAGGTALGLQINHRVSVDFDFFSADPIKKTLLAKVEDVFVGFRISVPLNNSRELTLMVGNVKYTFLHYPFPLVAPLVETDELRLLSVKEILATKAYSIGRRGSFKDYVDLYFGLKEQHATLFEIVDLALQKYGDIFNDRLFLEQLLFFSDVEDVEIIAKKGVVPSREELLSFFTLAIATLAKSIN